MWTLPILLIAVTILLSIPLSRYFAWIMDGRYHAPRFLAWFESRLNSGPQDWKQYAAALLVFNATLFVFGFVVLCLQPIAPLNPLGRGILAPSTIFNTVISFMTNTNLQHYSGDQHLSNFSQIFFILPNMFLSCSVGFCALTAIIRAFRREATLGNYKKVDGISFPFTIEQKVKGAPAGMTLNFETIELNAKIDSARFAMPAVKKEAEAAPKSN